MLFSRHICKTAKVTISFVISVSKGILQIAEALTNSLWKNMF
jgi:hypothetical protein